MEKDLAEIMAKEADAAKTFEELVAAKKKEIDAATAEIEEKLARKGETAVKIAEMKNDLEDTVEGLAEDKKFMAELLKNCDVKKKEYALYEKTMQEELLAIAETIKILNDDDALELFKKTLPSSSAFLQLQTSMKEMLNQALQLLCSSRGSHAAGNTQLD